MAPELGAVQLIGLENGGARDTTFATVSGIVGDPLEHQLVVSIAIEVAHRGIVGTIIGHLVAHHGPNGVGTAYVETCVDILPSLDGGPLASRGDNGILIARLAVGVQIVSDVRNVFGHKGIVAVDVESKIGGVGGQTAPREQNALGCGHGHWGSVEALDQLLGLNVLKAHGKKSECRESQQSAWVEMVHIHVE